MKKIDRCPLGRRIGNGTVIFAEVRSLLAAAGAAFKLSRRDGEGAAADAQHAADGVIKAARLFLGRIDDGELDALRDVEERFAVVPLDLVAVEVDDEVGIDVADPARNDERVIHFVLDLDVVVAVFDGGEKLVHRLDLHLIGDDVIEIARINAFRLRFLRVSAQRERHGEHGENGERQENGKEYASDFCSHITPPIPTPAQTGL